MAAQLETLLGTVVASVALLAGLHALIPLVVDQPAALYVTHYEQRMTLDDYDW